MVIIGTKSDKPPLYDRITDLSNRAAEINPYVPVISLIKILDLDRRKSELIPEYNEFMGENYQKMGRTNIAAHGLAAPVLATQITAIELSTILQHKDAWRDLESTLDRKISVSLAILAVYISILSLLPIISSYFSACATSALPLEYASRFLCYPVILASGFPRPFAAADSLQMQNARSAS